MKCCACVKINDYVAKMFKQPAHFKKQNGWVFGIIFIIPKIIIKFQN
jgi:hypothetical protein